MATSSAAPGHAHKHNHNHKHNHDHDHDGKKSSKLGFLTKERRLYGVIAIAFAFLIAELVIGFTNNALVLVADAFHITSDLIGYIVSVICIRLANQGKAGKKPRAGFTFGMQRAELLGAAFNGTFLLALGVSIILQAIDRFINPSELENAVLVAIIGGAGIASNVVMLAILGGHNHDHGPKQIPLEDSPGSNPDLIHSTHAHHLRKVAKKSKIDLNIFGVLLHVFGDALNSLAVIISAVVFLKTGWVYMDPLASLFGKIVSLPTRPSSSRVKLSTDLRVALFPFYVPFSLTFSPFISGNYDYRDGAATRLEIWPLVGRDGTERYDLAYLSCSLLWLWTHAKRSSIRY